MTMLLVNPQESHSHYYVNYRMPTPPSESSTIFQLINMSSQQYQDSAPAVMSSAAENNEVAQALEIARESPDGAKDPVVSSILENALVQIWNKVQAQPDTYVMSRDEFAVFNFFQYRFAGNKTAMAARKRYWDNTTGP
ncbi:uncharacterized protein PG998_013743 [Apiospora kogelbergensis]|uniref:Uncharacterized protein n=1 Tax=Apiospora kogelbergensis TaxID=1337665 RepID=A0AAW0R0G1_9PEZI